MGTQLLEVSPSRVGTSKAGAPSAICCLPPSSVKKVGCTLLMLGLAVVIVASLVLISSPILGQVIAVACILGAVYVGKLVHDNNEKTLNDHASCGVNDTVYNKISDFAEQQGFHPVLLHVDIGNCDKFIELLSPDKNLLFYLINEDRVLQVENIDLFDVTWCKIGGKTVILEDRTGAEIEDMHNDVGKRFGSIVVSDPKPAKAYRTISLAQYIQKKIEENTKSASVNTSHVNEVIKEVAKRADVNISKFDEVVKFCEGFEKLDPIYDGLCYKINDEYVLKISKSDENPFVREFCTISLDEYKTQQSQQLTSNVLKALSLTWPFNGKQS